MYSCSHLEFFPCLWIPSDDTIIDEATATGMPTTAQDNSCLDMFELTSNGCFYVQTDSLQKKTWQEAENFCQDFGNSIHLAEQNTPEVFIHYETKSFKRQPF